MTARMVSIRITPTEYRLFKAMCKDEVRGVSNAVQWAVHKWAGGLNLAYLEANPLPAEKKTQMLGFSIDGDVMDLLHLDAQDATKALRMTGKQLLRRILWDRICRWKETHPCST